MIPTPPGPIAIRTKPELRRIVLDIPAPEHDRLVALAAVRGCSVADVVRQFARTCQPRPDVPVRNGKGGA